MRKEKNNNVAVFLALVRAGLWETDIRLLPYKGIDNNEVNTLSQEQAVVGLVAAGLEHVVDVKLPKEEVLLFVGETLQLEQRNTSMNDLVSWLMKRLKEVGIHAVLVKGQGIAQCYEKPLWRSSGDIDLLFSKEDYYKARALFSSIADYVVEEESQKMHQEMVVGGLNLDLHGRMHFELSQRVTKIVDSVVADSLSKTGERIWRVNDTDINLPDPNNDIILVFIHFLEHFFIEGVGLRQICDWCRLLWTYKEGLDHQLLGRRLREMGLMSEWQVFGSLAVNQLGMPHEAMPFYDDRSCYSRKANRVLAHVLKSGNFGHNNDLSYRTKYSGITYKLVATWRRFWDFISLVPVFPIDAPKFFVTYVTNKMK